MPLLLNEFSVWEIGFRWAELDPDRYWIRKPLPVKDNFRLLMEATLYLVPTLPRGNVYENQLFASGLRYHAERGNEISVG